MAKQSRSFHKYLQIMQHQWQQQFRLLISAKQTKKKNCEIVMTTTATGLKLRKQKKMVEKKDSIKIVIFQ